MSKELLKNYGMQGSDEVDATRCVFRRFVAEDYEKLMQYAFHILSRKRYTVKEMSEKLAEYLRKRKKLMENDGSEGAKLVSAAVLRLSELGYLDDASYTRDYLTQRIKLRPRGKFLLRRELAIKGIDKAIIEKELEACEIDEFEAAKAMLIKKINGWAKYDQKKQKSKAYSLLASKGFGQDAIYRAIESCYYDNASWD